MRLRTRCRSDEWKRKKRERLWDAGTWAFALCSEGDGGGGIKNNGRENFCIWDDADLGRQG